MTQRNRPSGTWQSPISPRTPISQLCSTNRPNILHTPRRDTHPSPPLDRDGRHDPNQVSRASSLRLRLGRSLYLNPRRGPFRPKHYDMVRELGQSDIVPLDMTSTQL